VVNIQFCKISQHVDGQGTGEHSASKNIISGGKEFAGIEKYF